MKLTNFHHFCGGLAFGLILVGVSGQKSTTDTSFAPNLDLITPNPPEIANIAFLTEPDYGAYFDYISHWEGVRDTPYVDTLGNLTVGIGHKLSKDSPIREYKVSEITNMFDSDLETAKEGAKELFPSFYVHNKDVQLILTDMVFNIGKEGVRKFILFHNAIEAYDYTEAAKQIKESKYFTQTGKRAQNHYDMLVKLGGVK